jgi:hypothetical protein
MLCNVLLVVIYVLVDDHQLALKFKNLLVKVKNVSMYLVVHLSKHSDVKKLFNEILLLTFSQTKEVVVLV